MSENEEAPIEGQQEESALDRLPENLTDAFSEEDAPEATEQPEQPEEAPTEPTDGAADTPPAESGDVTDPPEEPDELHQRQIAAIERIERAAATYENAANRFRNNPTPENQRAAEKAKSRLQELHEADDLDLEPGKHIKTVASEFEGYQRQQGETQAQYDQRLAYLEQQNAYLIEQSVRRDFESQHPGLKYDEVVQQARQRVDALLEGVQGQIDPVFYNRVAEREWRAVIDAAKAKVPAPAAPKPDTPVKTPKHTQPIQSSSNSSQRAAPPKKSGLPYDILPDSLSGGWD